MDYFRLLKKLPPSFDVVIPFLRYEKELEKELLLSHKDVIYSNEKIFITTGLTEKPTWAQDWWPQSQTFQFNSKNEATRLLKSQEHLGVYLDVYPHPQASSIRKDLRELKLKRIEFSVPSSFNFKFFSWCFLDENTAVICRAPYSQFPLGWNEFNEDKETPPNRAYLKLWELLTLNHIQIKKEDIAIDLGSSPGGWSWVLGQQMKKVYSVDKAPLDPKIAKNKNIIFTEGDAFKIKPDLMADSDWLFSDIICTPEKLLELVQFWLKNSNVKNYVCTIKFKGDCHFEILEQYKKIENSKIIHLYQNKNEVTWIRTKV